MTLIRNNNHMNEQNILNKIIAFLAVLPGSIWIGSYAVRMIISYQLFDIDMNIMPYVNQQNLSGILVTINPVVITTFVLYIFLYGFKADLISLVVNPLISRNWYSIIFLLNLLPLPAIKIVW